MVMNRFLLFCREPPCQSYRRNFMHFKTLVFHLTILIILQGTGAITKLSDCEDSSLTHHTIHSNRTIVEFDAYVGCEFTVEISRDIAYVTVTERTSNESALVLVSDSPNHDGSADTKISVQAGETKRRLYGSGYRQKRTLYFILLNKRLSVNTHCYFIIYFTSTSSPRSTYTPIPTYNGTKIITTKSMGRTIGLTVGGVAVFFIIVVVIIVKHCVHHATEPSVDAIFSAGTRDNGHVSLTVNNENHEPPEYTDALLTDNDQTNSEVPPTSENLQSNAPFDAGVDSPFPAEPPPSYNSLLSPQPVTSNHAS